MVLEHLGSGMTLRALVPATGTTCGDIVLGVPQHPIPAEAVLSLALVLSIPWCPAAGTSWHSLRTSCLSSRGTTASLPPPPDFFQRTL